MNAIAVVGWSGTRNTEGMAKAVAQRAGADVNVIRAEDFDVSSIGNYGSVTFGCPAMGSEVLVEEVFEPVFSFAEGMISGKKSVLFGSYDWGDGQWMRDWTDCATGDGTSVVESLIANLTPGEEDIQRCMEADKKLVQ